MVRTGSFGSNGASHNDGLLPPSLLESASLVAPLGDNSSIVDLTPKTNSGSDIISKLGEEKSTTSLKSDSKLERDSDTNHNYLIRITNDDSPLFNQRQNFTSIPPKQFNLTKSNTTKSQDLLTGGTKDAPMIGTTALDPLLASSNNSLLSLPVIIDVIPPLLTVTALPVELVPGSPSARLVGVVNGTGSAIASLSVQIDDLIATPVSISPLGTFDHLLNFTGLNSGSHTLKVNATDSAGNISYASFSLTLNLSPTPPAILAALANDTAPSGTTNSDRITYDPTIAGTVKATQRGLYIDVLTGSTPQVNATGNISITETNHIVSLKAGFNNTPGEFLNVKLI
ncbi:hypothetical protein AB0758_45060 [Tolypothrix bouteillei VB521301_2]|uniref:hypothetical protein n=1 Tax=Tolypothrix bouteillei TaxID=1246981 RepID=UPI0038B4D149